MLYISTNIKNDNKKWDFLKNCFMILVLLIMLISIILISHTLYLQDTGLFTPNPNSWNFKTNKHKNSCYIITFMGDRQGFLFFLFIYQSPISLGVIVCKNKLCSHIFNERDTENFHVYSLAHIKFAASWSCECCCVVGYTFGFIVAAAGAIITA